MGAISLGLGVVSSGLSAWKSRQAAEEQRKKEGLIEQQAAEDKALFNKQYYQDMTKRTDVQNMLRILDENQRKADTRASAQAAITGATPEQQLASREVNRRTFADSLADIASNASAMRDQYLRDYQNNRDRYYKQRLGMQDQLASIEQNTSSQLANAASNAFVGGANMLGQEIDKSTTSADATDTQRATGNAPSTKRLQPKEAAGSTYLQAPQPADASQVNQKMNIQVPEPLRKVQPMQSSLNPQNVSAEERLQKMNIQFPSLYRKYPKREWMN